MKILVYGAGVLGSQLAQVLVRGGNDVTILARGKRAEEPGEGWNRYPACFPIQNDS